MPLDAIDDIGRGHRRAVGEAHALPEGDQINARLDRRERRRQCRLDLHVRVQSKQCLTDVGEDHVLLDVPVDDGIEGLRLPIRRVPRHGRERSGWSRCLRSELDGRSARRGRLALRRARTRCAAAA